MTTTTVGKSFPATTFTLVDMDSPESILSGATLTVTVRFTGDSTNGFWTFIRDLGSVTHKIELFADTIGPGVDVSLNGPSGAVGALVAGQDAYVVPIAVTPPAATLPPGLYELGAVITFLNAGALVGGISAFVGDAVIQVR
jgi:hypothetical protein